jgi:hypothetical protein
MRGERFKAFDISVLIDEIHHRLNIVSSTGLQKWNSRFPDQQERLVRNHRPKPSYIVACFCWQHFSVCI